MKTHRFQIRRKEITFRAETNEIENWKLMESIKTKNWFFEKNI